MPPPDNRLADSMGWEMQKEKAVERFAGFLLKMGPSPGPSPAERERGIA